MAGTFKPITIMLLQVPAASDLTQVERRALRAMAENAGAREVLIHDGPALTAAQVTDALLAQPRSRQ